MEIFWKLFDNLDQYVYVSDVETHELVYINKKLAKQCAGASPEELLGRKCYAAVQRCSSPCAICPVESIEEGCFREWWYYDPRYRQNLALTDTVYEESGRRYHLSIAVNIDNPEVQAGMVRNNSFDALANEALRLALERDTPDESMDVILEYIGKALNSTRVYIFEKNSQGNDDNTYEWVKTGIAPTKDSLQNVPREMMAGWYKSFEENRHIVVEDVEDMRESDPLHYESLKERNIRSAFAVPLYSGGEISGFYGVANPSGARSEHVFSVLHTMGHFISACIKHRELTRQIQREGLARAQENLDMINHIIGSGFWYMDFDERGEMTKACWSQEFRKMLGFRGVEDFPDRLESFSDRIHPEDREEAVTAFWGSVRDNKRLDISLRVMRKDGEYNLFHSSGLTARYPNGAPRLFVGTFINLTRDIRAREALEQARREAEEANAISMHKSNFMANMSHELRTPINVILGMDEMILRESESDATRSRALDIRSAAQILMSLINDILDFSKIESGQMHIVPAEYSLVNVLSDLFLLSESHARQKSLFFKMEIDPELPIGLYGDDLHIRQVLTNLLTNAIKYTSKGTVTLRLSGKRTGERSILMHCEVADTGMGIRQEDIDSLFIPYSRVDEYRNRHIEGTGLGLPIIINLLKLMGSGLHVDSVYGEGSVFSFDLEQDIVDLEPVGDIYQRIKDAAKEYEYKVSFAAPEARVLVVDDNSMNREIFTSLLKKTKIQVTALSSGHKCLELVRRERFDLIFMDHLMPEMDGVETLHHLRTMEGNLCKDTPVIALTANAFSGDRERYISLGFNDFLSKPIVAERLEAMIRQMLPAELIGEAAPDEKEAGEAPEDVLPEIEGVDWDYAALRVHDRALLLRALKKFFADIPAEHRSISELAEEIQTDAGLDQYRIRVHAMKSASAQLGMLSVSTLAKLLEFAARDGDRARIRALNPVLLDELEIMRARISTALGSEDRELMTDVSLLSGLLDMLEFYMAQMDIGQVFASADRIKGYAYPPGLQERIDALLEKISVLDFDAASEDIEAFAEEFGLRGGDEN